MNAFDVTPELIRDPDTGNPRQIIVPRGYYKARDIAIEPDASNATYFLGVAALHPGSKITIPGLGRHSLQGDVGFANVLRKMGARINIASDSITLEAPQHLDATDIDLSDMPDTAQTLAVIALFAVGPTTIRGLHTLRDKETDRLAALSTELSRLGARTKIEDDTLHIDPPDQLKPAEIETYDDHRMAMSFALAATRSPDVKIKDPQCVSKTYPNFFADLRKALNAERH
jgi:3-phosphoshikimate 1-carboxyvinyltransferase